MLFVYESTSLTLAHVLFICRSTFTMTMVISYVLFDLLHYSFVIINICSTTGPDNASFSS
jgi:hypothetical protein